MGLSAGFTLSKLGIWVISSGRSLSARDMADCTSRAAPSMSRSRSNCRVMVVEPSELTELMDCSPAMEENSRSRGEATLEAMVCGLAPDMDEVTWMVGNSTAGR